ncbi:putative ribonuclease P protein component 4 [Vairimorpha necatrix]|uniref:Ribonuclease P protein component 4 n=1 Tax=Vairimorpha necatrix TaxID=6039 RepID=A0AAX4JFN6_9MICR
MQNIFYLLRLFPVYKFSPYVVSKLLLEEGSSKVACQTCEHFYISSVNCQTSINGEYFIIECKGCKEITTIRIIQ